MKNLLSTILLSALMTVGCGKEKNIEADKMAAFNLISQLTSTTSENATEIISKIVQGKKNQVEKLSPNSFTYILLTGKEMMNEKPPHNAIGFTFNEIKIPFDEFELEFNGQNFAKSMVERTKQSTPDELNIVTNSDFKDIQWENSQQVKSTGSFTFTVDSAMKIKCLFTATNSDGKLKVEQVFVCNRKDPKSFKKAIKIMDRRKE